MTIVLASAERFRLQVQGAAHEAWGPEQVGATVTLHPSLPKAPDLETALPLTVTEVRTGVDGTLIKLNVAPEQMVQAARLTAHVVYGDSRRWQFFRKLHAQSSTLVAGLLYVAAKSLLALPRTLFDFARELTRRSAAPEPDDTLFEDAFTASEKTTERAPAPATPPAAPPAPDGYLRVEE